MNWIRVEDALPRDGQAVLVRRIPSNHHNKHTLSDGSTERVWRWYACVFTKGQTAEEVEQSKTSIWPDQAGNNLVPYGWDAFGFKLDGQDVSHWCAIDAPEL